MKQTFITFVLSLGVMTACNQISTESATPSASTDEVEVIYDEPETIDDVEPLDVTNPNGREASATATTHYFQCKTDDGELLTHTFEIVDYFYGETQPTVGVWDWSPTAKNGALKVTRTTPKGTQLVKSKSLKHGWHVVVLGGFEQRSIPFEVKPDVKGLIELSYISNPRFIADHALIRINYKYVNASGDRYDSYTAEQQSGKTFAQWVGTSTIDDIDWDAVNSIYQVQPAPGTTPGTFKSVAYRAPRFKGYVFTNDNARKPRGADIDLTGKKGVTLTYMKLPVPK